MIKIAFASCDGVHINEHFGWCKKFYLYELKNNKFNFLETIDSSLELEDESEKLNYKINSISKANIVCVSQVGPKASIMLKSANIFPLKTTNENESMNEFLDKLLNLINTNPPLWLKAILNRNV